MNATEAWTVGRLLTWTTDYLKNHGSDSARLDAEVLLAHALDCQRIELYTRYSDEPTDEDRGRFREMVKQRAAGTPVAYLVGYKEFYSDRFEVGPGVLIPRPETEHLVVEALDCAKQIVENRDDAAIRIADVGTGSGIIAITLAKQLPEAEIVAIERSPQALEIAKRNVLAHGLQDRVDLRESDLFQACSKDHGFDLIVSNPPYVTEAEFSQLAATVRDYEPRDALVAGPTGLETIQRLLAQAADFLLTNGVVLLEISPMLAEHLAESLSQDWQLTRIANDLAGHARVAILRLQSAKPSTTTTATDNKKADQTDGSD